jgi:hypothetical protein
MQTVHLSYYVVILIWVLIVEGLGIYWHTMRISQKLNKVLKAAEKSAEQK